MFFKSELLVKDEECAQVSLCLEEALSNTSELKKQVLVDIGKKIPQV